jgi:hypothetical protein
VFGAGHRGLLVDPPSQIRQCAGTRPRKSEAHGQRPLLVRTYSTREEAGGGARPALASRLASTATWEGPPREAPATPGAPGKAAEGCCWRCRGGCPHALEKLAGARETTAQWCSAKTTAKPTGTPAAEAPTQARGAGTPCWPRRKKPETPPPAAKPPGETARQAVRGAWHPPPGPRHHGSQGRRTATRERAPAPEWWPPAAPTHGKRPGPGPVTAAMGLRAVPET